VAGKDDCEYLEEVLTRLSNSGLTLRQLKYVFMQRLVQYLGHCIDAHRVHTTPDKITAIKKAPAPKNLKQLRSLIFVQYYSKFITNLSSLLRPFYQLLKAKVRYHWDAKCSKVFEEVQCKLTKAPVLVHYDPDRLVKLTADASE